MDAVSTSRETGLTLSPLFEGVDETLKTALRNLTELLCGEA